MPGDRAAQEKLAAGKVVQATTGAPVLRWQMQTFPQRQPPSYVDMA
jgi:hypothetical protein